MTARPAGRVSAILSLAEDLLLLRLRCGLRICLGSAVIGLRLILASLLCIASDRFAVGQCDLAIAIRLRNRLSRANQMRSLAGLSEPKVTVSIDRQVSGNNESHLSFCEGANYGRKAVGSSWAILMQPGDRHALTMQN